MAACETIELASITARTPSSEHIGDDACHRRLSDEILSINKFSICFIKTPSSTIVSKFDLYQWYSRIERTDRWESLSRSSYRHCLVRRILRKRNDLFEKENFSQWASNKKVYSQPKLYRCDECGTVTNYHHRLRLNIFFEIRIFFVLLDIIFKLLPRISVMKVDKSKTIIYKNLNLFRIFKKARSTSSLCGICFLFILIRQWFGFRKKTSDFFSKPRSYFWFRAIVITKSCRWIELINVLKKFNNILDVFRDIFFDNWN